MTLIYIGVLLVAAGLLAEQIIINKNNRLAVFGFGSAFLAIALELARTVLGILP